MSNVDAMKAQLAVRLAGMGGGRKKPSRRTNADSSDDNAESSDSASD